MTTTIMKKSGISFLGMLAIVFIAFKLGWVLAIVIVAICLAVAVAS